jgi:hypothetical protein
VEKQSEQEGLDMSPAEDPASHLLIVKDGESDLGKKSRRMAERRSVVQ